MVSLNAIFRFCFDLKDLTLTLFGVCLGACWWREERESSERIGGSQSMYYVSYWMVCGDRMPRVLGFEGHLLCFFWCFAFSELERTACFVAFF